MCLIAFAVGQNPHFPLVVAANRDEFFRRPTAAMDWWTTESGTRVLAVTCSPVAPGLRLIPRERSAP